MQKKIEKGNNRLSADRAADRFSDRLSDRFSDPLRGKFSEHAQWPLLPMTVMSMYTPPSMYVRIEDT